MSSSPALLMVCSGSAPLTILAWARPSGCHTALMAGMAGMGSAPAANSEMVTMSGLEDLSLSARSFWAGGSSLRGNMASAKEESLATSATRVSAKALFLPFEAT